ncbi:uroporphyrinogen-III synthase [Pelagerythrobacter rhizovicinus]|uniref:Uroporphyrinogen-III synthase n=1 Tax=Pelagerythrobacter rhizovicinus TaxID=2268576 RepID=A0A4Q2KMV8_9SPHN|nr:uroporphyrinogen-III synthase [Pelagerythrobacter rhizovicinus]RXZ65610.1 uroporphyrinogen-III synthase [Pelagerythrobacter rhizovicinus]
MKIFAVRPEPGLSATIETARAVGIAVEGCPLADVAPVAWQPPPDSGFDALLLGSANAVRHAGPALARWRDRPVHVVGDATAKAAQAAGLKVASVGEGHLQPVLDRLASKNPMRLLRLTGEAHVPLVPPGNVSIETRVVYRVVHRPIPEELAVDLAQGGVVLLHSGEAARHFARECDRLGLSRAGISLAVLAPRIGEAAGSGWGRVEIAARPADGALLALVRDICH